MFLINTSTKKFTEAVSLDLGQLPTVDTRIDFQLTDGSEPVEAEGRQFALTIGEVVGSLYKTDEDTVSFRYLHFDDETVAETLAITMEMDGVEILDDTISLTYQEAGGGASITIDTALSSSSPNPVANATLTPIINGKADSATTLAGYGITDAYTKTEIDTKVSSVYKYKGTVQSYSALPASGQAVGDVYNVETADSTHGIKAGDNVAWNGTTWDVLAGEIDLSAYATKAELATVATTGDYDDLTNKPVIPDSVAIEQKLDDYDAMLERHVLSHTPLCIEAVAGQAGGVYIRRSNTNYSFDLEYSWDNETWEPLKWDGQFAKYQSSNGLQNISLSLTVPAYSKRVYIRGNNPALYLSSYSNCGLSIGSNSEHNISFKAWGNAMSLVYKSGYAEARIAPAQCFPGLFSGNSKLVDAGELVLPATTLGASAYGGMFYNCQNLVSSPELPATVLGNGCYEAMFGGCAKLESMRVAFTSWGTNNGQYTSAWLTMAGTSATSPKFYCPSALDATNIGNSGIPSGWTVVRI